MQAGKKKKTEKQSYSHGYTAGITRGWVRGTGMHIHWRSIADRVMDRQKEKNDEERTSVTEQTASGEHNVRKAIKECSSDCLLKFCRNWQPFIKIPNASFYYVNYSCSLTHILMNLHLQPTELSGSDELKWLIVFCQISTCFHWWSH